MEELEGVLAFIREVEGLKGVTRTAWGSGGRQESTAEHSWRLALLAALLGPLFPQVDAQRLVLLCLVHDLGELDSGDVSAALRPDPAQKQQEEMRTVERLAGLLPAPQQELLLELWREYDRGASPEGRLAKALDKAETILQHNQGKNPEGFDYGFNLEYGTVYFSGHPLLEELRTRLDQDTRRKKEAVEKQLAEEA